MKKSSLKEELGAWGAKSWNVNTLDKNFGIRISVKMLDELDRIAKETHVSRTEVMRYFTQKGIDGYFEKGK